MHLLMILTALILSLGIRLSYPLCGFWLNRWQGSLMAFVVPPLLLLMTAIAVISMGYHGEMLGWPASRFSYLLSIIFLVFSFLKWLQISFQGWNSTKKIRDYPQKLINNNTARIIETDLPYSAQIGFWKPELIISNGLLKTLDMEHLDAVIAHEKAHANYHDTFWFFWLGWLRRISFWLPHNNRLWEDLLLLREIRADQQAATKIDPLILAESLLIVAQEINKIATAKPLGVIEAAFHDISIDNRLEERISFWLPHNNRLWEDLLLLREIRADQQAATKIDPLILAESLLIVAQEINKIVTAKPLGVVEAAFHDIGIDNRLEERIDALFNDSDYLSFEGFDWYFMLLTLLPLISIPFHS